MSGPFPTRLPLLSLINTLQCCTGAENTERNCALILFGGLFRTQDETEDVQTSDSKSKKKGEGICVFETITRLIKMSSLFCVFFFPLP